MALAKGADCHACNKTNLATAKAKEAGSRVVPIAVPGDDVLAASTVSMTGHLMCTGGTDSSSGSQVEGRSR